MRNVVMLNDISIISVKAAHSIFDFNVPRDC